MLYSPNNLALKKRRVNHRNKNDTAIFTNATTSKKETVLGESTVPMPRKIPMLTKRKNPPNTR
jgi:hypothetical protein